MPGRSVWAEIKINNFLLIYNFISVMSNLVENKAQISGSAAGSTKKALSRRDFLKLGVLETGTTILAACISESPFAIGMLPNYEQLTSEEAVFLLTQIQTGAKDDLAKLASLKINNLYNHSSSAEQEISVFASDPFNLYKSYDNRAGSPIFITSESRQNNFFYKYEGEAWRHPFQEHFYPGISVPAELFTFDSADFIISTVMTKELIALGMIDGLASFLIEKSDKPFTIVNIKNEIVADSDSLSSELREEAGLSLFIEQTEKPDINNPVWKIYDLLPVMVIASSLKINLWDKEVLTKNDIFKEIPIVFNMANYLEKNYFGESNLLNYIYQKLYLPLIIGKSVRTKPDLLKSVLFEPEFIELVLNFDYKGSGY